jgi:hypothetical protein
VKVALGQRVYADKVFAWPHRDTWDALTWNEDGTAKVEFAPIENPLTDKVAVVVGKERKKYRAELEYYCTGDGGATCGSEGFAVNNMPSKRTFIAIRYTLEGRRFYTTPEYLREVPHEA